MTDLQYETLMDEIAEIKRLVLFAINGPEKNDGEVPQPTSIHPDPENVRVHFGKNGPDKANGTPGKRLGDLSQMSLSYYAAKWSPKPMKNSPGFYWHEDTTLLTAARTLWHQREKTLDNGAPEVREPAAPKADSKPDPDIPF
jgi:hypothetical protein